MALSIKAKKSEVYSFCKRNCQDTPYDELWDMLEWALDEKTYNKVIEAMYEIVQEDEEDEDDDWDDAEDDEDEEDEDDN